MPPKRKKADEAAAAAASKKPRKTLRSSSSNSSSNSSNSSSSRSAAGKAKAGAKGKAKTAKKTDADRKASSPTTSSAGATDKGDVSASGKAPRPKRNQQGELVFPDFPKFRPNLSPKQVLRMGSFGGTYFRPIKSSVTGKTYRDQWKEFPADWFEGLDVKRQVASPTYLNAVNTYGVHCGGDLHMWESSGWIKECDPYGWFQWYCRFYLGRRCYDDERQISRGLKVFGPTGRWRTQLCNRILIKGSEVDDTTVSPKIRQLMQHWGYRITDPDLQRHAFRQKAKKG